MQIISKVKNEVDSSQKDTSSNTDPDKGAPMGAVWPRSSQFTILHVYISNDTTFFFSTKPITVKPR